MLLATVVYDHTTTAPFVRRLEGNFLCKSVRFLCKSVRRDAQSWKIG